MNFKTMADGRNERRTARRAYAAKLAGERGEAVIVAQAAVDAGVAGGG